MALLRTRTKVRPRRIQLDIEQLEDRRLLAVAINVDAAANRHLIDPNIYGTAFADSTALSDLNLTVNREGGNMASRYNWQQNAANHAADWYFESIGEDGTAAGAWVDNLIAASQAAGAQAVATIPTIGWVANLGANRSKLASYSVAKYGAQQDTDYWMPDAGNGILANGTEITWNNPNDANVPADVNFAKSWVQHLIARWGMSSNGGLRYYTLDNEPSIWHETHRDVHPTGATMEEVRDKIISYATMIKSLDPGAKIIGPEEFGWSGYLYSGYDLQAGEQNGWSHFPDREAHNDMDYLPWLLDQVRQHDAATGQRLLDYFTVHYYPQGGEFSDDVSQSMQLLRNRSTRSLWDPSYVDQSWIGDTVRLVPRLREWVNAYYPGTKIGVTEYNWGAEGHMNGATAQADVLGIFGREGLDLANRWTTPAVGTPAYLAMKMYRNYDGNDSAFGNTSVATAVANPDQVSAFGSLRASDGALTVMVVNKNLYSSGNPGATTSITINIGNFASNGIAQRWQLSAINPSDQTRAAITHLADQTFSGNSLTVSVPMQSVTMFVLTAGQATPQAPTGLTALAGNGQATLTWSATAGAGSYNIYRGTVSGGEGNTSYRSGLTATSLVDAGLSNGTTYFYQVTAVNSSGESARSGEASALPTAPPVSSVVTAINAAGKAAGLYLADTGFSGGSVNSTTANIDTSRVSNPAPQSVYRTWRAGNFTYTVSGLTASKAYTVRLHFSENAVSAKGQRVFSVNINGVKVLDRFDVFAAAGGRFKAIAKPFTVAATSGGKLTIQFVTNIGAARVNGIEVLPGPVLALAAGGSGAGVYKADAFFTGGLTASTTAAIYSGLVNDPAPQTVYQSERYGDFSYVLGNLTPGKTYTVRLDFAEIYWDGPGKRLFNVRMNGSEALNNFDIFVAAGGKNRAVRREFSVVADALGQIVIDFVSVVNYAKISGIAVL